MSPKRSKSSFRNFTRVLLVIFILAFGYFCFTIGYDLRVRYVNHEALKTMGVANSQCAETFNHFIADIEKSTNWKVEIISGLRTREAQIQLKRDNPRNAPVNKSRHVLGRAIDLNLYKRVGFQFVVLKKANSNASWLATGVPEIAKKYGLLWGGTYKTYHDPVHFEVN